MDTISKVPSQTNAENFTDEALRGRIIWDNNNCMGCHTILGEGAYYAPELTKAYTRRGPAWLKIFLKDPQAMFPNDRKMVQYNLTDAQIDEVIAFLKWISEMDLNGFPAEPTIEFTSAKPQTATANDSASPQIFSQLCVACHALGGQGGAIGPALDGVASRYSSGYLLKWISDPPSVKPGTQMPKLPLTEVQITELVAFLSTLK